MPSFSVASIGNVLHPCTARMPISCVSSDTIGALRPYYPARKMTVKTKICDDKIKKV